jgi:hypothetical protein
MPKMPLAKYDNMVKAGALVVNVGRDRLKLRVIKSEQPVPPIRMP